MGLPAFAAPFACTQQSTLVSAPLFEGDAAVLASAYDAGKLPVASGSATKSYAADPPEPVPPMYAHTTGKVCRDDLEPPIRPELPPPFDACPRRTANGGQFSAKTTRAERASQPDTCCYLTFGPMAVPGRALRDADARAVVAPIAKRADWARAGVARGGATRGGAARDDDARAWLADAALEHASIASFARLALDLMAHGAPPDLIAGAHAAALDEIEHARIAFAFASERAGEPFGPGALPIASLARDLASRARDLASLARETFTDGCIGETLAALDARDRAEAARDPRVRRALLRIARDEERHAELAWRIVAWMLRAGGAPVRAALRDVALAADTPLAKRAIRDVIGPCACALFAA